MKKIFSTLSKKTNDSLLFLTRGLFMVPLFFLILSFVGNIAFTTNIPSVQAETASVTNASGYGNSTQDAGVLDKAGEVAGAAVSKIRDFALDAVLGTVTIIAYLVFSVANYFLVLAGSIFNWAIAYLVFQFAATMGSSPGMLVAWSILRDVANIALLFGFIFMGIVTMLDLHNYTVQKTIPKFIIYAVLLNFSLLGVSAIIDGANVFAAAIYNQASGQSCVGLVGVTAEQCQKKGLNVGLGGMIVEASRIGTVLSGGVDPFSLGSNGFLQAKDKLQYTIAMFGLALFVMALAIVFAAGAVLLFTRAIVLCFLMVTSPIGVAGLAIEPLKDYIEKWWKMLFNNAIFAPVFLLLIFVSLKISEGVSTRLTTGSGANNNLFDALTKGDVSTMGSIVVFGLIIGFLWASLLAAKQFGVVFADAVYNQSTKTFGGVASNMFAIPGRTIIGGASNAGARLVRRSPLANIPILGQALTGALDKGAKSSFDVRGLNGVPKELGRATKAAQGGRRGIIEDKKNQVAEHVKSVQKERDAQLKEVDAQITKAKAKGKGGEKEVATLEKKRKDLIFKSLSSKERKEYEALGTEDDPAVQEYLNKKREALQMQEDHEAEGKEIKEDITKAEDTVAKKKEKRDEVRVKRAEARAQFEKAQAEHPEITWEESEYAKALAAREASLDKEITDVETGSLAVLKQRQAAHTEKAAEHTARVAAATQVLNEQLVIAQQAAEEKRAEVEARAERAYKTYAADEYTRNTEVLTGGIQGVILAPIIDTHATKLAVAALRGDTRPESAKALEHLMHAVQHEALASLGDGHGEHDDHAPAAKPAAKPAGGGDGHGGGGAH